MLERCKKSAVDGLSERRGALVDGHSAGAHDRAADKISDSSSVQHHTTDATFMRKHMQHAHRCESGTTTA